MTQNDKSQANKGQQGQEKSAQAAAGQTGQKKPAKTPPTSLPIWPQDAKISHPTGPIRTAVEAPGKGDAPELKHGGGVHPPAPRRDE